MKIVHVVDYLMPSIGYQEFHLPVAMAKLGHDVSIITSDRYSNLKSYDTTWKPILGNRIIGESVSVLNGVNVIRLPVFFEFGLRPFISNLIKTLIKISPDIIYIHGTSSYSYFVITFFSKRFPGIIVCDNHTLLDYSDVNDKFKKIFYFIIRVYNTFFSKRIKYFFGVEKDCCRHLVKMEGVNPAKVRLLPLGYNKGSLHPLNSFVNHEHQSLLSSNKKIILQCGKLSADKDPFLLYLAFKELIKTFNNLHLVFLGDGPLVDIIKADEEYSSFESCITFIPSIESKYVPSFISSCDVVVFPKGSSLTVYDAASLGKPVFLSSLRVNIDRASLGLCYVYGCTLEDLINSLSRYLLRPSSSTFSSHIRNKSLRFEYTQIAKKFFRYF